MMPSRVSVQKRATLFIPKFYAFSNESKAFGEELLPGAKACVINNLPIPFSAPTVAPFGMGSVPADNGPWQLTINQKRLLFLPNRVDFIDSEATNTDETLIQFLNEAINIFRLILNDARVAVRVAYGVVFAFDNDADFNNDQFFADLLPNVRMDGAIPREVSIRNLFSKQRQLGEKTIPVNSLINLSCGIKTDKADGAEPRTSNVLLAELDINTAPNASMKFDALDLNNFYKNVTTWSEELLSAYFK